MPKTHPVSISTETHGLTGNLLLPDGASKETPVPGVVFVGGPGPIPLARYSDDGAKQWPVLWSEAIGNAGLAAMAYDQRGSGLSGGTYHEADWHDLYADVLAVAETLQIQPEITKVIAISWGEGASFALQLAAEEKVDGLVLLSPICHTAERRYEQQLRMLAARKGLSERVVMVRLGQWQQDLMATVKRVEHGEVFNTTEIGGHQVTTNMRRMLQTFSFDPAVPAARVRVPTLLQHGADDTAISPSESEALAAALPGPTERLVYPGVAHFIYREQSVIADATAWLRRTYPTKEPNHAD